MRTFMLTLAVMIGMFFMATAASETKACDDWPLAMVETNSGVHYDSNVLVFDSSVNKWRLLDDQGRVITLYVPDIKEICTMDGEIILGSHENKGRILFRPYESNQVITLPAIRDKRGSSILTIIDWENYNRSLEQKEVDPIVNVAILEKLMK